MNEGARIYRVLVVVKMLYYLGMSMVIVGVSLLVNEFIQKYK